MRQSQVSILPDTKRSGPFDQNPFSWFSRQIPVAGNSTSRAVASDPYQLRIYVPDGFAAERVELSGGLTPKMAIDERLLTVDYMSSTGNDVEWKVFF